MNRIRCRVLDPISAERAELYDDAWLVLDGAGHIAQIEAYVDQAIDEDLRALGVITPGFVDAHVHAPQHGVIGQASGPLLEWLDATVFPEETRYADPEYAHAHAHAFVQDLIAHGTTSAMIYGSVHAAASHALFEALDARHLHAIAGPVWMDEAAPEALCVSAEQQAHDVRRLVERWHNGRGERLQVAIIPRFAVSCSPAMLDTAGRLADELDLVVTTHLAETLEECTYATKRHQAAYYLDIYAQHRLLKPGSVFAHCIHLQARDWALLAGHHAIVAHCPDSNAFLGSGTMPTTHADAAGVPLTLGSDVAAGRSLNMLRAASCAFDNALRVGLRTSPQRWFWTLCAGGAKALGWSDVGRIAQGYTADLVLHRVPINLEDPTLILNHLLFNPDATAIEQVWIAGRIQLLWTSRG